MMVKKHSTIKDVSTEVVELSIIETLLKGGEVVIPEFGCLEVKLLDDRKTVFFTPFDDNEDSSRQIVQDEANKEETDNLYTLITLPLKEVKTVNLPRIGIFRPVIQDDDKIRVSYIPSSYLREQLNQDKENVAGGKISSGRDKDNSTLMPKSSVQTRQRTIHENDLIAVHEDIPERHHSRNISGTLLAIVAVIAVLFVVAVLFSWNSSRKTTEPTESASQHDSIDLPLLAEQHYGNRVFWIYIYDANMDKLESPMNIPKNVSLVIPDLEAEFDVDVNDDLEIQRAKIKAEIVINSIKNKINTSK